MAKVISGYKIGTQLEKILGSEQHATAFIKKTELAIETASHDTGFNAETYIKHLNIYASEEAFLTECDPATVKDGFLKLATLGLIPGKLSKEAYLVKTRTRTGYKADLFIGVGGHCKIIQAIFPHSTIEAKLLSKADTIKQRILSDGTHIEIDIDFEQELDLNKRENLKGVFISLVQNDYTRKDIIPISYIEGVEKGRKNRGGAYDIWTQHYGQMAVKTALIKFSKDLVVQNQSKFSDVFYKALEAERETSGYPALGNEIEKKDPQEVLEKFEDIIKEGEF